MSNYTAMQIAEWFLAWAEQADASLSNLKLQKLLYYAQGHALGATGQALFDDDIQAWAHGPVVPNVYHAFKSYGNGEIDVDEVVGESFDWGDYRKVERHLMLVWNTYGKYEAWALRNRTHTEAPWRDTFDESSRGLVITQESMRDFFKQP